MTRSRDAESATAQVRQGDRWISRTAAATVAGLAGVAGALSYSHMRQLAQDHGQTGWHAHAFPLSVDGIEVVASLVLLADRRAGRRSGWLPWTALAAGAAGSLAANIAAAHADPVSRIIAGWPALTLLVAVKLISGILEVQRTGSDSVTEPVQLGSSRAGHRSRTACQPPSPSAPASAEPPGQPPLAAPELAPSIAALLPAARAAGSELRREGRSLTRDALAARMRQDGRPVRNASLTPLLRYLRQEHQNSVT